MPGRSQADPWSSLANQTSWIGESRFLQQDSFQKPRRVTLEEWHVRLFTVLHVYHHTCAWTSIHTCTHTQTIHPHIYVCMCFWNPFIVQQVCVGYCVQNILPARNKRMSLTMALILQDYTVVSVKWGITLVSEMEHSLNPSHRMLLHSFVSIQ